MLTDQQKIELVQRYGKGERISAIATSLGSSYRACWAMLKRRNVEMRNDGPLANRKYTFDTKVFDAIDTQEKAYWLGFLYADGYNFEKRYTVSVRLAPVDVSHLRKYRAFLSLERPFSVVTPKKQAGFEGSTGTVGVIATDMHFSKRLRELGVTTNKSFNLQFPTKEQVPHPLLPHFIRGYFDGDGCISIGRRKLGHKSSAIVNIVGSRSFILQLQRVIESVTTRSGSLRVCNPMAKSSVVTITVNGNGVSRTLLDWLYKDATVYLDRKHKKYQEVLRITT